MNPKELVCHRLNNQLVSNHLFKRPEEVVHWMGAMQAQDYTACLLAIGLRMPPSLHINQKTIEQALAVLAHLYINSHGPATVYDFASWAGLMVSEARIGIELNASILSQVNFEGKVFWFLEPEEKFEIAEKPKGVYLLPAFDEMLCGYKDKSAILNIENVKATILRNGIIRPIIVVNNRAVGTWKWDRNKENVILDTLFSKPLTKQQNKDIEAISKRLQSFFISKNQ